MALRVLLGDESSTIKKVFQLALQDFAVEVRPVNIGVDVVSVAQTFKPDIIFIDVLLQKKNGYDVSSELKVHPQLKDVPVVLMWSGFMELDQDKFEISMANAQLEKPFDVGALRKLVGDLVPKTNSQRLSQFLTFPKMPELEEQAPPPPEAEGEAEAEEDFKQISIPKMKKAGDEKFRLNMKPEELDPDAVPVDYSVPGDEPAVSAAPTPPPSPPAKSTKPTAPPSVREDSGVDLEVEDLVEAPASQAAASIPHLTPAQIEMIIKEQSAEVIEQVVWKVIPELAKQIIERELNKLLQERDSHPY